jgi:hypothetical protein
MIYLERMLRLPTVHANSARQVEFTAFLYNMFLFLENLKVVCSPGGEGEGGRRDRTTNTSVAVLIAIADAPACPTVPAVLINRHSV